MVSNNNGPFDVERILVEEFTLIHDAEPGTVRSPSSMRKSTPWSTPAMVALPLCLSGGGIRSASFGLGVLQALARRKLLFNFHYLSTVSGGGYIGGWLTAWRRRMPDWRWRAGSPPTSRTCTTSLPSSRSFGPTATISPPNWERCRPTLGRWPRYTSVTCFSTG